MADSLFPTMLRCAFPQLYAEDVRRLLWDEIRVWGLTVEQQREWQDKACWFPTLRHHDKIMRLLDAVPKEWQLECQLCEPQILVQLPDDPDTVGKIVPHIDELPPWAKPGSVYTRIVGVPLTKQHPKNGGLHYWPKPEDPRVIYAEPGDVFSLPPNLPHASGWNVTSDPRAIVYFRFLKEPT